MPDLKIFAKTLENTAKEQIDLLCAQAAFKDAKIRIMPDVHAGAGCVIGFTADLGNKVIPNIVGVDIGCGMLATKVKTSNSVDLEKLDSVIKRLIPAGRNAHDHKTSTMDLHDLICYDKLKNPDWMDASMGTLGGGNHFIELDVATDNSLWLVIHTGSRNVGKQVAEIYQDIAISDCSFKQECSNEISDKIKLLKEEGRQKGIYSEISAIKQKYEGKTKLPKELCYVEGEHREQYLSDMRFAQRWAVKNREMIAKNIFDAMGWEIADQFCTIHNYIDDFNMIRKGSIAARVGERVIIPLNMRDGSIIAIGKGNEDWNCSAPHGAGRLMSRSQARDSLKLSDFTNTMKGIYTTTATQETIDEAPMVYKDASEIISLIGPTVEVKDIIKPIYNFKAAE